MDGQNFNNEQENMYQDNTATVTETVAPVVEEVPEKKTDALAVISLVTGIISLLLMCCYPYVGIFFAIAGIILAIVSKKKNGKSGLATAGLICSIIGVVLSVIMLILLVVGVAALAGMGMDLNSLY